MNFPFQLQFKILVLAPQVSVTDASGGPMFYVRQKLLKFKEDIEVFSNESRTTKLFNIKADRVIDFSANYSFVGADGQKSGSMKRSGMRSLFSAHYVISDASDTPILELSQLNPWAAVLDSVISEIPIVGLLSGYFLNPVYGVYRPNDPAKTNVMKLIKKRSFLESGFEITKEDANLPDDQAALVLLAAILVTFLERDRG